MRPTDRVSHPIENGYKRISSEGVKTMTRLTMRERRELLCQYLQQLASGVANYSISDWAVNHLLLELIQLSYRDRSVFEVVNEPDESGLPLPVKDIEEELTRENIFT